MTAIKPYLIRAIRDWAVENGFTPHVVVDASASAVDVPTEFVKNGRILLNIHPRAVHDFDLQEEWLVFSARFGGQARALAIPVAAIRAIYARENGQGVAFPEDSDAGEVERANSPTDMDDPTKKGPHLKIVK
ncbi:MAG: ClpXP protease specificity-enhancing factor [Proteobacteria bacterium]|nr:ClpXP protease specificity-enhancing factor [Pseudomonadota bacterium]